MQLMGDRDEQKRIENQIVEVEYPCREAQPKDSVMNRGERPLIKQRLRGVGRRSRSYRAVMHLGDVYHGIEWRVQYLRQMTGYGRRTAPVEARDHESFLPSKNAK